MIRKHGKYVLRLPMRDGNGRFSIWSGSGNTVLRLPMRDGNTGGGDLSADRTLVLRLPMRDGNRDTLSTKDKVQILFLDYL